MLLRIDLTQVPPIIELINAEDFAAFSVVVATGSHTWVEPATLLDFGSVDDVRWRDDRLRTGTRLVRPTWTHPRHVELVDASDRAAMSDD